MTPKHKSHKSTVRGVMLKSAKVPDSRGELALLEYQPLREEVNRTIDRMTANEVICGSFVFAVIASIHSIQPSVPLGGYFSGLLGACLAFFVAFGGARRSAVFRRHMDAVDAYLADLEFGVSSSGGWTNHYNRAMKASDSRQMGTRIAFWHVLRFVALLNLIFCAFVPFFGCK